MRQDNACARELHRLAALHGTDLLDRDPPAELRALAAVAADLLGGEAFVTLIDDRLLHPIVASGTPRPSMPRSGTVCDRTIGEDAPVIVTDVLDDPRYVALASTIGVRFYAGIAIHAPDSKGAPHAIGTLCVLGPAPREATPAIAASLRRLGALADALIDARATARRATGLAADVARRNRMLDQAEQLTRIGAWRISLPDRRMYWSDGMYAIYGLPADGTPAFTDAIRPYDAAGRARVARHLERSVFRGDPFDFEEDFRTATGVLRRIRCVGEREEVDGVVTGVIGVLQDITDQKRTEDALRRDARTDALTGLANRQGFDDALAAAMVRARSDGTPLMLAMMDLDRFKWINDSFGHDAGDEVLRAIGRGLADVPAGVFAARLGGDEFAAIVECPSLSRNPARLVVRLEEALRVPVKAAPVRLLAAGSVGVAPLAPDHVDARDLIRAADAALYTAKGERVGDRRRCDRQRSD